MTFTGAHWHKERGYIGITTRVLPIIDMMNCQTLLPLLPYVSAFLTGMIEKRPNSFFKFFGKLRAIWGERSTAPPIGIFISGAFPLLRQSHFYSGFFWYWFPELVMILSFYRLAMLDTRFNRSGFSCIGCTDFITGDL
jgi:hypothetical protein